LRINSEEKVSNFSISKLFFLLFIPNLFFTLAKKSHFKNKKKKYWPAAAA